MLLEMAVCWSSSAWDKGAWSNSELCSMKKNVLALMVVADPSINPNSMAHVSIDHLLEKIKLGTQGKQRWMKRTCHPPKPGDLGPIYNMKFKSSTNLTEMGLKHELVDRNKKEQQRFFRI
jgi:hypothetical protein